MDFSSIYCVSTLAKTSILKGEEHYKIFKYFLFFTLFFATFTFILIILYIWRDDLQWTIGGNDTPEFNSPVPARLLRTNCYSIHIHCDSSPHVIQITMFSKTSTSGKVLNINPYHVVHCDSCHVSPWACLVPLGWAHSSGQSSLLTQTRLTAS